MWLLITTLGYFLLALAAVLDKFILTKSVGKPVVYTFYSTIFMLAAFAAAPFGGQVPAGIDMLWAIGAGVSFGLALHVFFVALKEGEASHMNPFIGGVVMIATYIFSALILRETLTNLQSGGVMILAFATFLLSFEKSKKHSGFHMGFLWAILSGILFAISQVGAKYLYEHYSFITGLVWSRGTAGFFALFLLFLPSVRSSFHHTHRRHPLKTYGRRHALGIVVGNKIFGTIGLVLAHYAISIGSVTIVNALAGLEYAFIFIIVFTCTKFAPKVFKEYFTKRELTVELIAIVLMAIGSVFFVL